MQYCAQFPNCMPHCIQFENLRDIKEEHTMQHCMSHCVQFENLKDIKEEHTVQHCMQYYAQFRNACHIACNLRTLRILRKNTRCSIACNIVRNSQIASCVQLKNCSLGCSTNDFGLFTLTETVERNITSCEHAFNCFGFFFVLFFCLQVLTVDSASSIASPNYPGSLTIFASYKLTCSWKVVTKDKDYLELTFDDMSISSCGSTCLCGKITVREDYQYGRDLGTFCQGKALKVSSKRNVMFVEYYPSGRFDKFKATIRAKNIGMYWSLHLLWGSIASLPN